MSKNRLLVVAAAAVAASLAGCGDEDAAKTGDDVCATQRDAVSTRGCNGAPPGPQTADTLGGSCVPDDSDADHWGSCRGGDIYCQYETVSSGKGICVVPCDTSIAFVSTGGCPTGYRCFNDGSDGSFCYPDCVTDSDCSSGLVCIEDEGSCYVPDE